MSSLPSVVLYFLEPFCLRIINDSDVRGFRLHSSEVRLLTYADDVAVFCEDMESISRAIVITKEFCRVTKSAVNWSKCSGFFHGEWASTPSVFENVSWSRTPVRYLGVPQTAIRIAASTGIPRRRGCVKRLPSGVVAHYPFSHVLQFAIFFF